MSNSRALKRHRLPNDELCILPGEEQFHYFAAFPASGSARNSTSATQTSTLKFMLPKQRFWKEEQTVPKAFHREALFNDL